MIHTIKIASVASLLTFFMVPASLANSGMGSDGSRMSAELSPLPAPCSTCCEKSPAAKYYRTGFYAGGQVGYIHMDADFKGTYTDINGTPHSFSRHSDPDGVIGDAFLGGRFVFDNCFVAGFEMGASLISPEAKHKFDFAVNNNGTRRFKVEQSRRFAFTPSFVGGYVFSERWMAYGRLGLAIGHFHMEVSDLNGPGRKPLGHSETKFGVSTVAGVECGFSSTMSARAELGAEFYQKFGSSKTITIDNSRMAITFKPYFYTAKVGVVVKM